MWLLGAWPSTDLPQAVGPAGGLDFNDVAFNTQNRRAIHLGEHAGPPSVLVNMLIGAAEGQHLILKLDLDILMGYS